MILKEFFEEVQKEFEEEKQNLVKEKIKERLREVHMAELTLKKMKKQLNDLLEKDLDDIEM